MWKQVCQNTNLRLVEELPQTAHYRNLALRLFQNTYPRPPVKTYIPTLTPEQVFCVIELYRRVGDGTKRRVVTEALWVSPLTFPIPAMTNHSVTMQGANPYSKDGQDCEKVQEWKNGNDYFCLTPFDFALLDIKGSSKARSSNNNNNLHAKVTLFRRDTMESVCVLDQTVDEQLDSEDEHRINCTSGTGKYDAPFCDSVVFANNEFGRKAESMLYNRNDFYTIKPQGQFVTQVMLPGLEGLIPTWLLHCNQARINDRKYVPTQDDLSALSRIPHFDINVGFRFDFVVTTHQFGEGTYGSQDIESLNEMMVIIEGLCWK